MTTQQRTALRIMVNRLGVQRVATNVGVHRNTVSRWLYDHREPSSLNMDKLVLYAGLMSEVFETIQEDLAREEVLQ